MTCNCLQIAAVYEAQNTCSYRQRIRAITVTPLHHTISHSLLEHLCKCVVTFTNVSFWLSQISPPCLELKSSPWLNRESPSQRSQVFIFFVVVVVLFFCNAVHKSFRLPICSRSRVWLFLHWADLWMCSLMRISRILIKPQRIAHTIQAFSAEAQKQHGYLWPWL